MKYKACEERAYLLGDALGRAGMDDDIVREVCRAYGEAHKDQMPNNKSAADDLSAAVWGGFLEGWT